MLQRHKKRKHLYHKKHSIIRLRPKYRHHIWSIDFVHDKLAGGRSYKMLTVLDECTREALCVAVKPRMGNAEVLEALYPLFLKHGRPEFNRSDKKCCLPVIAALHDMQRNICNVQSGKPCHGHFLELLSTQHINLIGETKCI